MAVSVIAMAAAQPIGRGIVESWVTNEAGHRPAPSQTINRGFLGSETARRASIDVEHFCNYIIRGGKPATTRETKSDEKRQINFVAGTHDQWT
jgi:hypothetical protein